MRPVLERTGAFGKHPSRTAGLGQKPVTEGNFQSVSMKTILSAVLVLAGLLGCGPTGTNVGTFRGVLLPQPVSKPSFTLSDLDGRPYDLVSRTRGKVTLLFFGYTHCPDVCPLHMANIAAVLKQMSAEDRANIITIFVTTDPERDTPDRLRDWLANFDPSFVGLTGTPDELARAQRLLNLQPASREYVAGVDSANYFVGHAAQVYAFARDGNAYTVYPFGIRQEDWANDLPRLARDATGSSVKRDAAAQLNAIRTGNSSQPRREPSPEVLSVINAVVAEPASEDEAAAYLTFRNDTPREDTLVAVAADLSVRAEVHQSMSDGAMRHMMAVPKVVIPPMAQTSFAPGGTHIMLMTLRRHLTSGDTVTLYLSLAREGGLTVRAPVIPYASLEQALSDTTR